jgi:hypothetical protein
MDTFLNVLPDIIGIIATLVFSYLGIALKKNSSKNTTLAAIQNVAKEAVTIAEKTGIAQGLTGSEQFKHATMKAQDLLDSMGVKGVSVEKIEAAIETAYAQSKTTLNEAYPKGVESSDDKVAKAQEAQAKAEAQVQALKQSMDTITKALNFAQSTENTVETSKAPQSETDPASQSTANVESESATPVESTSASVTTPDSASESATTQDSQVATK